MTESEFIKERDELIAVIREMRAEIVGKDGHDINSPESILALMTDGEGPNVEVYKQMAGIALRRLRKAFSKSDAILKKYEATND